MIDQELMERATALYGLILDDKVKKTILKNMENGKHPKLSVWFFRNPPIYNLSYVKAILGLMDRIEQLEKKFG